MQIPTSTSPLSFLNKSPEARQVRLSLTNAGPYIPFLGGRQKNKGRNRVLHDENKATKKHVELFKTSKTSQSTLKGTFSTTVDACQNRFCGPLEKDGKSLAAIGFDHSLRDTT